MTRDSVASGAAQSEESISSLLLYTHNVARALKPSQHGELAHAVHETLHYALDGSPQDYLRPRQNGRNADGNGGCADFWADAQPSSSTSKTVSKEKEPQSRVTDVSDYEDDDYEVQPGFFATGDEERPFVSYDWCSGRRQLTLPHPKTVTNPILSDPCTSTAGTEADLREEFDVTAKFFFLQGADRTGDKQAFRPEYVKDALEDLASATGIKSVETMVLAFPTMQLDQRDANGKDASVHPAQLEQVANVWRHISPDVRIGNLGLSDLSRTSLAEILQHLCPPKCPDEERRRDEEAAAASAAIEESMVKHPDGPRAAARANGLVMPDSDGPRESTDPADPLGLHNEEPRDDLTDPIRTPSSPSKGSDGVANAGEEEMRKAYGPGTCRRPRLCTINLREQSCDSSTAMGSRLSTSNDVQTNGNGACCCWDRGLADYCKQEKIMLVAHSDQRDILPAETLPTMLNEFADRLPRSVPAGKTLVPVWCLKYTVLIRDRGVLADKGFILYTRIE